jgi:hypothetical protein
MCGSRGAKGWGAERPAVESRTELRVDDAELPTDSTGAEGSLIRLLGEILSRSPQGEIATQDFEELRKILANWFAEMGHTKPLRRNFGRGA